jgi:hypothetical protein
MDSRQRINTYLYTLFCKYIHIIRYTQTQYKQTCLWTQMFALCGNRTRDLLRSRRVFPPVRQIGRQSCDMLRSILVRVGYLVDGDEEGDGEQHVHEAEDGHGHGDGVPRRVQPVLRVLHRAHVPAHALREHRAQHHHRQ